METTMKKSKKKRIIVIAALVIFVPLLAFGGSYLYTVARYQQIVSDTVIVTPDLQAVKDGTYLGEYDAIMVSAEVSVTVKDGEITDVVLVRHKTDRGVPAERITQDALAAQSLEVDTITGATNSSKVILKAIENALNAGISA